MYLHYAYFKAWNVSSPGVFSSARVCNPKCVLYILVVNRPRDVGKTSLQMGKKAGRESWICSLPLIFI